MPKRPKIHRQSTYPEPGAWVLDRRHGLPKLGPPEPFGQKGQLTAREVGLHVAYEGLGFCIFEYVPTEKIADKELARLWEKARLALREIVKYLEVVPLPTEQVMVGERASACKTDWR